MNRGFSPVLAQLLMAGLSRRALLSAGCERDQRPSRNRWDWPSPVGSQFCTGATGLYSPDALDWGIAAYLSGKAKACASGVQTLSDAGVS
jgi:hypothetical protein